MNRRTFITAVALPFVPAVAQAENEKLCSGVTGKVIGEIISTRIEMRPDIIILDPKKFQPLRFNDPVPVQIRRVKWYTGKNANKVIELPGTIKLEPGKQYVAYNQEDQQDVLVTVEDLKVDRFVADDLLALQVPRGTLLMPAVSVANV